MHKGVLWLGLPLHLLAGLAAGPALECPFTSLHVGVLGLLYLRILTWKKQQKLLECTRKNNSRFIHKVSKGPKKHEMPKAASE